MKKLITGLFISGTILITSSYAYTTSQIQQITQQIGEKIETIINKKTTDTYKRLELYLLIQDKLNAYASKKPNLKNIIKQINLYLQKDYLPEIGIIPIQIKYVVDGDTVRFINLNNGKQASLRMVGIDTPESNKKRYGYAECYGEEAKQHLKDLTKFKEPYAKYFIETDESQGQVDKYGRTLGYLLEALNYKNGTWRVVNLNGKQIKDGYAWEYTYNKYHPYKYQSLFKEYQKQAKEKGLGLWNINTCNGQREPIDEVKNKTAEDLSNVLNYPTQEELQSGVIHQGDFEWTCPTKRVYCTRISSCDEAKFYLKYCGATYLDRNKDGIPCENLCSK